MRKHIFFSLLILAASVSFSFAQTNRAAALRAALGAAANDSARCAVLFQLAAFYMQANIDSLEYYGQELLRTATRSGNAGFKISGLNALGLAAKNKGDYQRATDYFFEALRESERIGNVRKAANVLLNLADAVNFHGQKNEAIGYLHRGLRLAEQLPDSLLMTKYLNNLGYTYSKTDADSAFFYYRKAYELWQKTPDADFLGLTIRANLSAQYSNQKNYEQAMRLSREVLESARLQGNDEHIFFGAQGMATSLNHLARSPEALPYAQEALAAAQKFGNLENEMQATGTLAEAFRGAGDFKNATEQLVKYARLRDTLQSRLVARNLMETEAKYKTQAQATELAEKNLLLERQRNRQNALIFSVLAILAAAVAGYFFLKNRQRLREREAQLALQIEHAEAEKLRELDAMKSAFFANISHEFRTPLTLLLGPLREMRDGTFRGDAPHFLHIMVRNAERLLQLINQLLDLSKLESGKLKLQLAEGDLSAFLRAIVGSFESMAARKSIHFEAVFPEKTLAALFDKDCLEKILSNLLSNAFKFSPDEGRVFFEAKTADNQLFITVGDEGAGIAPEQLPRIFDRFYQADSARMDDATGSGIGLALTKELVELHGGRIAVESELGRGTIFTVALPLVAVDGGRLTVNGARQGEKSLLVPSRPPSTSHRPPSTVHLAPSTVLVADDNADVRAYIVEHLRGEHRILEASDGLEALETALREMPDLIVTDIMMPRLDGTELTRKLKTDARTSHIPVVMLTAKVGQAEKIEGLETGADDYLTKPFDGRELQLRAHNLLQSRARMREKFSGEIHVKPKDVVVNSVDEQFLQKIMENIEQRMADEQFGVEDLARAAGMSRSQLHRKLTALTGLSPVEIIRKMRLERALDLLRQGAGNVSEVAYRVGFSSQPYFSTCFSEHFGYPPGEVARA